MNQSDLLFNVVLLVSITMSVLYAMYLLYNSNPAERQAAQKRFDAALDKAVDQADKLADETKDTEVDNMVVDLLKQLIALSREGKLESILALLPNNAPATTSEPLHDPAENRS